MADLNTGIYEIKNTVNGKRYVGSAICFSNRKRQHFQSLARGDHHSIALQRAYRVHGGDAFEFRPLLVCAKEHLLMYEQILLDGLKPEYNIAPRAGSQLGYVHTPETRKKLSAAAKRTRNFTGRAHSPEARAKISAAKTGVVLGPYSAERVQKTAKAMRQGKGALTEDQVRLIRKLKAEGLCHRETAASVGCTYSAVADVARGATFNWVK